MTKTEIIKVVSLFLGWRLALFLLAFMASTFLPYKPSFPYSYDLLNNYGVPAWVASWANFDGVHYLTIVEKGYKGTGLIQAFFPTYPLLTKLTTSLVPNALLAGLLVSQITFLLALLLWYSIVKSLKNKQVAWWATVALLCFPTSFFWVALYSESVFLLSILISWWALQKKNWLLLAVTLALITSTRVVGVWWVLALGIERFFNFAWPALSKSLKKVPKTLGQSIVSFIRTENMFLSACFFGCLGIMGYMVYLAMVFGDPLYFLHVQAEFGAGRQEQLIVYPQVVWRYLKILLTARPFDWKYFTYVNEFVAGTVGLLGLGWATRRAPLSWSIFSLLAFFTASATGTFSSLPRYYLVSLPVFLWLGEWLAEQSWQKWLYLLACMALLIINTMLFIQGYWVA